AALSPERRARLVARAPGPSALLLLLAGAALVAPEMPGLKLAIAWAVPLVFHAALLRSRAPVALAAGACAALAAAALDAGLAAALVLPGVAAALVLAARDACWSARDLGAL